MCAVGGVAGAFYGTPVNRTKHVKRCQKRGLAPRFCFEQHLRIVAR